MASSSSQLHILVFKDYGEPKTYEIPIKKLKNTFVGVGIFFLLLGFFAAFGIYHLVNNVSLKFTPAVLQPTAQEELLLNPLIAQAIPSLEDHIPLKEEPFSFELRKINVYWRGRKLKFSMNLHLKEESQQPTSAKGSWIMVASGNGLFQTLPKNALIEMDLFHAFKLHSEAISLPQTSGESFSIQGLLGPFSPQHELAQLEFYLLSETSKLLFKQMISVPPMEAPSTSPSPSTS